MGNRSTLTDKSGEVADLARVQTPQAIAFKDLPVSVRQRLTGIRGRGPQKAPTKERISIRLSADVLQRLRALGPGWQGRVDQALKDWLDSFSGRR